MWQVYRLRPEEFYEMPPETRSFYIASHEVHMESKKKAENEARKEAEIRKALNRK